VENTSSFQKIVSVEDAETARRIKEEDARLERWKAFIKEVSILGSAGAIAVTIGVTSALTIIDSNTTQEDKSWARTTLTSVLTGAGGFLFGKHEASKKLPPNDK